MAIESAACPNCGASLQVDDRLEKGICEHCDSLIIIDDAIQKFKIDVTGKVEMVGIGSAENDITYGNECIIAEDWKRAYDAYIKAICKQVNNHEAWLGCLKVYTKNLTEINENQIEVKGIYGIISVVKNSIKYAPSSLKNSISDMILSFIKSIEEKENQVYYAKLQEIEYKLKNNKKKTWIPITVAILSIILGAILIVEGSTGFGIPLLIISIAAMFNAAKAKTDKEELQETSLKRNDRLLDLLNYMRNTVNDINDK